MYVGIAEEHKTNFDNHMKEGQVASASLSKQAQEGAEEKSKQLKELIEQIKADETDANVLQYINY